MGQHPDMECSMLCACAGGHVSRLTAAPRQTWVLGSSTSRSQCGEDGGWGWMASAQLYPSNTRTHHNRGGFLPFLAVSKQSVCWGMFPCLRRVAVKVNVLIAV